MKSANPAGAPYVPADLPEQTQLDAEQRAMALRRIAQWTLGGLGVGAGLSGLYGLAHWLGKPKVPEHELSLSPQEVELTYPGKPKDDEKPRRPLRKAAGGGDWADQLAGAQPAKAPPPPSSAGGGSPAGSLWDWDMLKQWWALPVGTVGAIGGLYGGHRLVDWLMEKRRKADTAADVDDAKSEYDEAVRGMYAKGAAARDRLDDCFDAWEKKAKGGFLGMPPLSEIGGAGAGMYLTLAALLAGGTGVGMYNYMRSRSKSKTLEDALKQRAQLRALQNPPEMHLRPQEGPPLEAKEEAEELV